MAESIVGVVLSGPSNTGETAVVLVRSEGPTLRYMRSGEGTDLAIWEFVSIEAETTPVSVGVDAPLSYEPGGGDRLRDRELRKLLIAAGLHPGSVMAPTMQGMGYLTLRGVPAELTSLISAQSPTRRKGSRPSHSSFHNTQGWSRRC